MTAQQAAAITDEIFSLYEKFGSADYIGEPVSQVEHMLQAALLAEEEGHDDEVILAAFHDIGHLVEFVQPVEKMEGVGVVDHEKLGADFLSERGFSERLCRLVQSHVEAKRYLTYKHPAYYDKLSDASKQTLLHQGGRMTEEEAKRFEVSPDHQLFIQIREWDDKAKKTEVMLPSLQRYRAMAVRHLTTKII